MSRNEILNLSEVDPPVWHVMSGKISYGPYTLGQLQRLIQEAKLKQSSKVAEGDGGTFRPAIEHKAIQRLFSLYSVPKSQDQPEARKMASKRFLLTISNAEQAPCEIHAALNEICVFIELFPGTFTLHSDRRLADIHKQIRSACQTGDRFILAEIPTGRLAWHGLPADTGDHIREIWKAG